MLINGIEKVRNENLKNPRAFIDYSQAIDDVCENLEGYNLTKKVRVLILFDDMIADMETNKKLNATHYFMMKILNKREIQQIASRFDETL